MADASPTDPTTDEDVPPGAANTPAAPKLDQKVDLDLDDAPFLMDEPEEAPAEPAPGPRSETREERANAEAPPPKPKPFYKKPVFLAAAGAVLVLVVVATLFLSGGTPPPAPPPSPLPVADLPPPQSSTEVVTEGEGDQQRFLLNMRPFVILLESQGGTRMLTFKLSVYAEDPPTRYAVEQNEMPLRNVLYDFLRTRTTGELTSSSGVAVLKESLRRVIVGQLPETSKVGEVFIEQIQIQ